MNTLRLSDVNSADWFLARPTIQPHTEKRTGSMVGRGVPVILRNGNRAAYLKQHTIDNSLLNFPPDTPINVHHRYRWEEVRTALSAGSFLSQLDSTEFYWRKIPLSCLTIDPDLLYQPKSSRLGTAYFDLGWLGPSNTVQTFHQDNEGNGIVNHNFFMQLVGHKYVAIAHPDEKTVFAKYLLVPGVTRHSSLDPRRAESQSISSLRHAVLAPGDLLYIPPGWWHFLVSMDVSLSVSRWWFSNRIAQELYAITQADSFRPDTVESRLSESDYFSDILAFGGEDKFHSVIASLPVSAQYRLGATLARIYCMGGN